VPGRTFELGSYAVTEEEIVAFARKWDPLPFHVDPVAAAQTPFGGLFASGAHTIAIMVRLGSDGVMRHLNSVIGAGVREIEFSRPVRPGTTLTGHGEVLSRDAEDRSGRARTAIRFTLTDEAGAQVLSMVGLLLA
jgi:acyl dehydratase